MYEVISKNVVKVSHEENVKKTAGFSTWTGAVNEFTRKVLVLDVYDKVGFGNEEFIKEAFIIVNTIKLCKLPPQKDSLRGKG